MERVFADTGYWIALLNPRDDLHAKALATSPQYSSHRIVTSEMVLVEFLNSFSDFGERLRHAAVKAVQALKIAPEILIIPQTSELFENTVKRYENMTDKAWSLTDCASFSIMEEQSLGAALTHDRHFVQAGFQALLR